MGKISSDGISLKKSTENYLREDSCSLKIGCCAVFGRIFEKFEKDCANRRNDCGTQSENTEKNGL